MATTGCRLDFQGVLADGAPPVHRVENGGVWSRGDGRGAVLVGAEVAGRYRLAGVLGRGGFGEVWRATDLLRDREVAIKFLGREVAEAGPVWLGKFKQEARIAVRLTHPGITRVDDFGEYDGQWYLVMELLHGESVAAELARHAGGLPVERVRSVTVQVVEALAVAHAAGVVHRDLKPANLMALSGGRVKICDFGIARWHDAPTAQTLHGRQVGTPLYMSPEQWRSGDIDQRADLYSLGCVLYALLTGRPPFTGESLAMLMARHLNADPPPLRQLRPDVPADLEQIAQDLLAKDPADRPASAEAVAARLMPQTVGRQAVARSVTNGEHDDEGEVAARSGMGERVARRLLSGAEDRARFLDASEHAPPELPRLAAVWWRMDPERADRLLVEAEKRAAKARVAGRRACALAEIARAYTSHDRRDAERLLNEAVAVVRHHRSLFEEDLGPSPFDGPDGQRAALAAVAGVMAVLDPEHAERLARDIDLPRAQAEALLNVAAACPDRAGRLLEQAETVTRGQVDGKQQGPLLVRIAVLWAAIAPERAERLARGIVRVPGHRIALARVAAGCAESDRERSVRLLEETEGSARALGRWQRRWPLAEVAAGWALIDPERAERVADAISGKGNRRLALAEIAAAYARTEPERAEELMATIPGPWSAEQTAKVATAFLTGQRP
ncbi:serine/threonine-protein kinase [Actinomadura montaniterrae]|uniref:serine/threonine-protein kinase n=1 Tax=Actinomadura montaniterrae TaxID=1803903 RepID=UPI00178C41C6|nr:serine/threonine-protein kinase [Actinomadura montaniterrae]